MRRLSVVEAELAEARKNLEATEGVLILHKERPRFVELAKKSRERFLAQVKQLESEKEALCQR